MSHERVLHPQPDPPSPVFTMTSTRANVLRDKVGMVTMPSSQFVFARYRGNVIMEAPSTGDRVVATIPLGPMGVSNDYHVKPKYMSTGFVLSPTKVTVMHPDPWAGALIIASSAERLQAQRTKVLGESNDSTLGIGTKSDVGTLWLTHTCRNLWDLATTIPADTPVPVVTKFLEVMQDNLLNALILATDNSPEITTVESGRARLIVEWIETHHNEPLTVADLAAAVELSVRQLQISVQEHLAMSPVELLRDIRLSMLHKLLRNSNSEQCTVAALTYSVGFTDLGRATQNYRFKYGESPSQTLKRRLHG
jgi:AraC-like DNA-binding protein